jgi:hypothetical protein
MRMQHYSSGFVANRKDSNMDESQALAVRVRDPMLPAMHLQFLPNLSLFRGLTLEFRR